MHYTFMLTTYISGKDKCFSKWKGVDLPNFFFEIFYNNKRDHSDYNQSELGS